MTPVAASSFAVLREVVEFARSPRTAMTAYETFPRMAECVLTGAILYLAFALLITKFQLTSLHDNPGSSIK